MYVLSKRGMQITNKPKKVETIGCIINNCREYAVTVLLCKRVTLPFGSNMLYYKRELSYPHRVDCISVCMCVCVCFVRGEAGTN